MISREPSSLRPTDTAEAGRPFVKVAFHLYLLQGISFLVPLLALPLLLRTLGPELYGTIVLAQALVSYAVIVTDYGYPLTAARDISVARSDPGAVTRIFWTTLSIKFLLLVACSAGLVVVTALMPQFHGRGWIVMACAILVVGNVLFPVWYLQGVEKLRQAAAVQLLSRCASTLGVVIFVRSPQDVVLAALLISAPPLLSYFAALALGTLPSLKTFYRPTMSELRTSLLGGWHVFAGTISTTLYLQTNAFVLGLLSNSTEVAYFGVGYSIVLAVQGLAAPAIQSVYPRVSLLFVEEPLRAWRLVKDLSWVVLPAIGIASLLTAIFAGPLVQLIAGTSYSSSVQIVRMMSVLPLMITVAAILGPTVMMNAKLSRQLMWIYITTGLLNLVLLPYLVLSYAARGAAVALIIAETVGPIAMLSVIWQRRRTLPGGASLTNHR